MKVAIIIPTFNGAHKIVRALDALKDQTFQNFTIYIVIDGSTDNTLDVINNHLIVNKVKIIVQENGGRSVAKNRGVLESSEELLIFMDDDMIPCKEFVEAHRKHHLKFSNSILTGGLENHNDILITEFGKFAQFLHEKWSMNLSSIPEGEKMGNGNYFVTSGNASMLRSTFNIIGGFDNRLNDAEDYLFSVMANRNSIDMYYSKSAWAYHYELKSCRMTIKRFREYILAQIQLKQLDNEISENSKYYNVKNNYIKNKLFLLFAFKFWIDGVDSCKFTFLPQQVRFKLYDVIITANGVYFPNRVKL
jgi:glycosyltransferase involved in cell wall biosynthesis